MKLLPLTAMVLCVAAEGAAACELCAIYSAANASGLGRSGFTFAVSEQYIPFHTSQFEGVELRTANPDFLDSSITHFVPGYNFSPRFGLNLNVPLNYRYFQRTDLRYSTNGPPVLVTDRGAESDLGDAALVARLTVLQKTKVNAGLLINLLAGIKFPTGDTEHLREEIQQTKIFESLLPPGTPHDPLAHSISSVHPHDLSPGSGSYDGVFGATVNARWHRAFFNGQAQYYLRTEGESTFTFGDEIMLSGGPGAYLILHESGTLSLQINAVYDTMARDSLLGRVSDRTGQTGWYLGPQIAMTWGRHLSANAGIDLPIRIQNNGFQNVADYRLHAGVTWQF